MVGPKAVGRMIVLTFDTDHVREADLARFLSEFPLPGRGTFFLDRRYPNIDFGEHEVGLHPVLADRDDWRATLSGLLAETPHAGHVIRPHSCTYSHMLGVMLAELGVRAISQTTPLFTRGLRPYRHPWGLWELPIYYMDSMDMTFPHNWPAVSHAPFDTDVIKASTNDDALYVYDFHPVHIMLNTPSFAHYQAVKPRVLAGESPTNLAAKGHGARWFYEELIKEMNRSRMTSTGCRAAIPTAGFGA